MDERNWPEWDGLRSQMKKFGNTDWHSNRALYGLSNETFNYFLRDITQKVTGYVTRLYSWYTGGAILWESRKTWWATWSSF